VAQLNSALDYGSRGYWFESSQGHKTPTDVGVFLCFEVKKTFFRDHSQKLGLAKKIK
jgi:hypothetical protein